MNAVWTGPASYERARTDVPWDPRYLQLDPPTRVYMLAEFGPDAAGSAALSPMAITTPFRVLSDEGTRILQTICGELEAQATGDVRLPKRLRGGMYRSEFLRGLYSDPTMLGFLRELAQAPVEAHPLSHHALQINYAPDDLSKNVDQWHRDAVSYDYVMMVSDPRPMKGGRFEYFFGSVEEGRDLLMSGQSLPPDRVRSAEFPGAGWAVLQQGYRVLHRAARLEERYPRITMVCSYYTPHPSIADPADLSTLRKADGREIALIEWSRYSALLGARKLQRLAETQTNFTTSLTDLREALRESIADVEQAIVEFDSQDEGRLISFGAGN